MTPGSLGSYGRRLRGNHRVVWLCTVLASLMGLGLALSDPVVYHSTAVVVATPQPPPGSGRDGLRRAPTVDSDAHLLLSDRVLSNVVDEVGHPGGLPALREDVDVTARATSRVLRVRVTADTARSAQVTADAVSREFLRIRAAADAVRFESAREGLENQIAQVTDELMVTAAGDAAGGPDPEVAALQQELIRLHRELTATRASVEVSGFVAEPAPLPTQGIRPLFVTTTVSAGLLGFAVGASVAVARGRDTSAGVAP